MIDVTLPYGDDPDVWTMIRWCRMNIPKKPGTFDYPWYVCQRPGEVTFSFENANDAMRFKLVWG